MEILFWVVLFFAGVYDHLNHGNSGKKGLEQTLRYDLRDVKRTRKIALCSTVVFGVIMALFLVLNSGLIVTVYWDSLVLVAALATLVISLFLWADHGNCICYLKCLRRNGYEPPEKKSDYKYRICKLNRVENVQGSIEGCCKDSIILAGLCWTVAGGLVLRAIYFTWKYRDYLYTVNMCMFGFGFMLICWIVVGCCYWKQRINSKFRDDINPDMNRKLRVNLMSGVGFIVAMVILSGFCVWCMEQMMGIVINAREQAVLESRVMEYVCDERTEI